MLTSMTGFGQSKASENDVSIQVEIKSVNNRFLDVQCRIPSMYSELEQQIVALVKSELRRGRVDISLSRKSDAAPTLGLRLNTSLVSEVVKEATKLGKLGVSKSVLGSLTAELLSRREVVEFVSQEQDSSAEFPLVLQVVEQAVAALKAMRDNEGQTLAQEISRLLALFEKTVSAISEKAHDQSAEIKARLSARIADLMGEMEVNQERLYQEIAFIAEKADITEELARIGSHVRQFRDAVAQNEGGRKLEFLLQELGREINTCGSKSHDVEISKRVVDGKSILEKLREQVLNVE